MNKKLRRRKTPAKKKRQPRTLGQERTEVEREHVEISSQVRNLEEFIVYAPSRALEYRLRNVDVVPPPDAPAVAPSFCHPVQMETRMSFGEQHRRLRSRNRNFAIFLLLLCGAAVFFIWFARHFLG